MEILNYFGEIWKPIRGYENLYEVSNMGRIRSFDRVAGSGHGSTRIVKGRILKPQTNRMGKYGYLKITLHKDNQCKQVLIHRLVAEAFIPNPLNLPEVDHINTISTDNRACNLRWVSRLDNHRNPLTIKHNSEALKDNPKICARVLMIKDGVVIKEFNSITNAAKYVGGNVGNITHALRKDVGYSTVKGKRYSHICKTAYGYEWEYAK